jgi:hypothetical protein
LEGDKVMSKAQDFMSAVWERRNNGADTESKLVAAILMIVAENTTSYTAQNGLIVLDKNEILKIAEELELYEVGEKNELV